MVLVPRWAVALPRCERKGPSSEMPVWVSSAICIPRRAEGVASPPRALSETWAAPSFLGGLEVGQPVTLSAFQWQEHHGARGRLLLQ